jgi:hypothetical protein
VKLRSTLGWLLRTLNGETWGASATKEAVSDGPPSQDLPGLDNKGEALPSNMNQFG